MPSACSARKSVIAFLVPLILGTAIWFFPVPEGLTPEAWHMFAIFAATIAAILTQPLPSGAVMLIALCVVIFAQNLVRGKSAVGVCFGHGVADFLCVCTFAGLCDIRAWQTHRV